MSDTLINRLRGLYCVGPENVFGTRSFADFIPPISLEAADVIEGQAAEIVILRAQLEGGEAVGYNRDSDKALGKKLSVYTHPAPVVPELDVTDLEVTSWPEQKGGMHVGMEKGVKIKQKSTGIEVCCDTERNQHLNRNKCFSMLSAAKGDA